QGILLHLYCLTRLSIRLPIRLSYRATCRVCLAYPGKISMHNDEPVDASVSCSRYPLHFSATRGTSNWKGTMPNNKNWRKYANQGMNKIFSDINVLKGL